MPSAIDSQIQDRIQSFVAELDQLVRKSTLAALQDVLGSGAVGAARRGRPAGVARGPKPGRGRGRRGADLSEVSEKIAAHVRANDGQGIGAIAQATGVPLPVAKKAAQQLLASKQIKKSGQKRGTVYHAGSGKRGKTSAA